MDLTCGSSLPSNHRNAGVQLLFMAHSRRRAFFRFVFRKFAELRKRSSVFFRPSDPTKGRGYWTGIAQTHSGTLAPLAAVSIEVQCISHKRLIVISRQAGGR